MFPTNKVTSTRYTVFNFLPITFLLQFTKVINVFYLGNAILQSFPSVSTNDPLYTIIPLSVLIFLGILKEGLADYKRYKIDKAENAAPVLRLTGKYLTENKQGSTKSHTILEESKAPDSSKKLFNNKVMTGQDSV